MWNSIIMFADFKALSEPCIHNWIDYIFQMIIDTNDMNWSFGWTPKNDLNIWSQYILVTIYGQVVYNYTLLLPAADFTK